jgi:DNA-binding MarR family transcriptional regulator
VTPRDASKAALALGGDLRIAIGRVARRMKQLYAADDPRFSEMSVLSRLELHGATSPSTLAAAEHVRPQAMGATLSSLEQRRLVRRSPDPADRRKVLVEMTAVGRRSLSGRHQAVARRLGRALDDGFTTAEQRQLAAVVPLLERLAGLL